MSSLASRAHENNTTAQLAAQFNEFYLSITLPVVSQIGNYKIVEEIGEGAFGKVYLAQHVLLNAKVVLKCGLLDDPNIVREIYYHQQLKNKNIVKLYEVIKTELHIWMALEYCEGGELFYYIYENRRLDIDVCRNIFYQIAAGIKYVHSLNLAHRDLKLENILLADKRRLVVKLTDFGFVREFNPYKRLLLSTVCGTSAYMAPEMLKNEKYSGFAVDMWSMGVILYAMVYGELPFDDDDEMQTRLKIMTEEPLIRTDNVDPTVTELLRRLLNKDPAARPSISEVLNLSFIIDLTNEHMERKNSYHNDTESIVSINQHYNQNKVPFQTKIERELLKRLEKLNIDIDLLQALVHQGQNNTLTAFYELGLTREFKKKRYKHKRRRYNEARRQIRRSRKRVRSALSLPDQNSGTQPLEKIISSLSIGSHRGHPDLASVNRKSTEEYRRLNPRASMSKRLSRRPLNVLVGPNPQSPSSPGNGTTLSSDQATGRFERQVSFTPDDRRSTLSYPASTDQSKSKKILNKLQFWKKGQKEKDDASHLALTEFSDGDSGVLEINLSNKHVPDGTQVMPRNSHSPARNGDINETDVDPLSPNGDSTFQTGPEDQLEGPAEIEAMHELGHHRHASNQTSNTNNTGSSLSEPVDRTNNSLTHDSIISSGRRQRPESMVSQISQYSQLSQPYPMSESELEMMDGTDMDEDYYDEDGIYELSINNSQQDLLHSRHSSTGMTPSTSTNLKKKRPSTTRLASDTLIMTTSTQATGHQPRSKKHSLSQVSSNSSDDSELRGKLQDVSYFSAERPLLPRLKHGFSRNGAHPSLRGPRQTFRLAPSPGVHTPSPSPVTPLPNSMGRSPSPPIFKKFNTMSGVVKPMKNVLDLKKSDNSQNKWMANGDQATAEQRWRHDGGTPSRIYERQAIITEEDEEED